METLRSGVGRRINFGIGIGFALVMVVGGVSVFLAWTILRGAEQGKQELFEEQGIDWIHVGIQQFVADLYLVLQGGQAPEHQPPEEVLGGLKRAIAAYESHERAQGGEEAGRELKRLHELKSVLAQLEAASLPAIKASQQGQRPTATQIEFFHKLTHEQVLPVIEGIHALHHAKLDRIIDLSYRRMLLISALYVAFGFGGALLLLLGNRFLSRSLVRPITRLAQAALHISDGDLSQRVPVRSGDEVGQLSRAFNLMADQLEAHEAERLNFEAELERQVRDRTRELEETATRLRATQAELIRSERIAVTGQIAAGVTHEIRTPLNSMAINAQLLRRELSGESSSPSVREALNVLTTVEYEITRINRILEEFVKFARLPAPRFEEVEVGPLLKEILELFGPQAAESGVIIDARLEPSVAPVRGDRDQLREVFLNLWQNALEAMPNGGILGVRIDQDGEWVEVGVTDSGSGIPDAEREQIFLPFVSSKAYGLGLGLAIARRIVEEHGGSVTCQDAPGGGARFVVRLPATRPGHGG